jgi:hypothetical protein
LNIIVLFFRTGCMHLQTIDVDGSLRSDLLMRAATEKVSR